MHVKCLALHRNETHHDILQRDLFAWMFEESLTNPKAPYHVTRGDLIEQLGLTPDGPAVPPGVGSVRGEGSNKGSDPSSEEEGDEEDNKGAGVEEEPEEEEQEDQETRCILQPFKRLIQTNLLKIFVIVRNIWLHLS